MLAVGSVVAVGSRDPVVVECKYSLAVGLVAGNRGLVVAGYKCIGVVVELVVDSRDPVVVGCRCIVVAKKVIICNVV